MTVLGFDQLYIYSLDCRYTVWTVFAGGAPQRLGFGSQQQQFFCSFRSIFILSPLVNWALALLPTFYNCMFFGIVVLVVMVVESFFALKKAILGSFGLK
jgi:hypothetical protein